MRRPVVEGSVSSAAPESRRGQVRHARRSLTRSEHSGSLPASYAATPAATHAQENDAGRPQRANGSASGTSASAGWLELGGRAPGRRDLLDSRGRERVRGYAQPADRLAGAEHLHELAPPDRAARSQILGRDLATRRIQGGQPVQVHHLIAGLEPRVGEPLQLRKPAVQRHLAAFERGRDVVPRLAALGASPGGLALRGIAAADPGLGSVRARRRTQVVDLQARGATLFLLASPSRGSCGAAARSRGRRFLVRHVYCTSSTTTRWRTTWIMPRNSGRSALMTLSPILCRPSERRQSRCAFVPPIFDFVWVTFSSA